MENEKLSKKFEILQYNQSNFNKEHNQDSDTTHLNKNFIKSSTFNDSPKSSSNMNEISASIDEVCNFKQSDEIKCLHDEINEKNKLKKKVKFKKNIILSNSFKLNRQ